MYSTAADGNVTLQLKETEDLDRGSLAAMLAKLQDDATFSISYQDTDILSDGSIDVLLGTDSGTLQGSGSNEAVNAAFDLFDSSSGPDLTLSPETFPNSTDALMNENENSNSAGAPNDTSDTVSNPEEKKVQSTTSESVKMSSKRARPKAASPNRQGPQQCQVCAKVFGNASALAKHKLTHSDERKYVCTMCGKAFKRQDHLNSHMLTHRKQRNGHMLTHRNKKPFECKAEGCGKSYCDARSLRRHTENHHATPNATTMSPAQGAASGDAASPHGSSCIQYAPPPTSTSSSGKSQLQQLLATEPAKGSSGGKNDGLTKQQLDLIHQIMEQTQKQSQVPTTTSSSSSTKPSSKTSSSKSNSKTSSKVQRVWSSSTQNATKTTSTSTTTQSKSSTTNTPTTTSTVASKGDSKPVECNLCHRKFKNIPALNGHMRLHGGYFKKDADNKKSEKKEGNAPPLQTASISVRALIEEKIINKRTTNAQPTTTTESETAKTTAPPLLPLSVHSSTSNDAESKISSFVVPTPPQSNAGIEKTRRHSDAEAFTVPKVPTAQDEADALADLILKRDKSVKRTTSDPGQSSSQIIEFEGETFTLAYQNEDGYLSPSLQDEVFNQVQDSMLLQDELDNIQFQTDGLLPEQEHDLQEIASLEDYAHIHDSVVQSPSYQSSHTVNQDLQAVLNSPLPESLAEFSTYHSTNNMEIDSPSYQTTHSPGQFTGSPHTLSAVSPLQSPLIRHDSPGFAYPTPPASHEGQSPCFGQNTILPMVSPKQEFGQVIPRDLDEPPQASSPLSAAFFTSTMSSSAAVEEALEEVLPGETIASDELYPLSNSPHSPLNVNLTPVHSPVPIQTTTSVSTNTTQNFTIQPSILRGPDDPLLSQTSKEFNRFKIAQSSEANSEQPVQIVVTSSNQDVNKSSVQNQIPLTFTSPSDPNQMIEFNTLNMQKINILVDAGGGDFKIIQTGATALQHNSIILTGAPILSSNTIIKSISEEDGKVRYHKLIKGVQPVPLKVNLKPSQVTKVNLFDNENQDIFISPTTVSASPVRVNRKRPRTESQQMPTLHQSRLRASKCKPHGSMRYTPQPILNPTRPGPGLYCNIKNRFPNEQIEDSFEWNSDYANKMDSTPQVNVGRDFQCSIPSYSPSYKRPTQESSHEDLLWDPGINKCTDNEIDMYLDFACCAAVPGGGRNREYAMHLLHLCGGNIHEAMLKLMQPSPSLPANHPLLYYHYNDSDKWSTTETEIFHHALLKYDKDFASIAQEVGTKTVKQCVQFYYIWKKVCTDEYRRIKVVRGRKNLGRNADSEADEKVCSDAKLLGIPESGSPMPINEHNRSFICEFTDCSASFNSKAALNGHIRIHGGSTRNSPTPSHLSDRRSSGLSATPCHIDTPEDYPCKICGKVFTKVKSRSAHMKSHRPPDAEPAKQRKDREQVPYEIPVSSPYNT